MSDDTITRLRRLYAEATPGPWEKGRHHDVFAPGGKDTLALFISEVGRDQRAANMALVLRAHILLPALLDVAEAARRYADDSEDAEAYALLRHALARLEEAS